ncbi:MAG: sugar phosphate isomerase/epimerase [Bryobacterales bacterium]|nr:sugar phosphate isomerase/epimerase [Bryobacterales bacterium]
MISRRVFLSAPAALQAAGFRPPVGLALYSLRYLAAKDLPGTLALAGQLGFKELEAGDTYGRSPAQFAALLNKNGLRATSIGASYKELGNNFAAVADRGHALGARYVMCATIPHSAKHLQAKDVPPAADNLNKWGEQLLKSGVHLCYHTHGTEFDPSPDGTQFDTLAKLTNPKFANFEMDIFWIVYGRQDPVAMLRRYPGRFPLMHVKDMSKRTVLGGSPADVEEDESVPLGVGVVDVKAALLAAQQSGVKHYYLEEEARDAIPQIRQSLHWLTTIR